MSFCNLSFPLPRAQRLFKAMVVSAGVLAAGAGAAPAQAASQTYVAYGDSYSSGPGFSDSNDATPWSSNRCLRSRFNYPSLLATQLKLGARGSGNWSDFSCAGARVSELAKQVEESSSKAALGPNTQVVSFTIGGNDSWSGSGSVWSSLTACAGWSDCRPDIDAGLIRPQDITTERAVAALKPIAQAIKQRSFNASTGQSAQMLMISYLSAVPTKSSSQLRCGDFGWGRSWRFSSSELQYLNQISRQLLETQKQAAQQLNQQGYNLRLVDATTPSAGHDVCADASPRWIQPPTLGFYPFSGGWSPQSGHPTALGMQAMADLAGQAGLGTWVRG